VNPLFIAIGAIVCMTIVVVGLLQIGNFLVNKKD
jgi:hypothetical protein